MRASAQNRIFGLLTQWGLRVSLKRLREPDAMAMLEAQGVPEPWRASITEALAVIDLLDSRAAPIERELRALAAADKRVMLLRTIPGVGDLLGLTIAWEMRRRAVLLTTQAHRLRRPGAPDQPIRRSLADRGAIQGRLTDAALGGRGSRASVLANDQPLARALQRHRQARRQEPGQVRGGAQGPDRRLARALTRAALYTSAPTHQRLHPSRQARAAFWPPDGPAWN
jgi:hypothetical protein